MLVIGRVLMARPKLLLMNEPSMGLAPIIIEDINADGVPVVLVEQNAGLALDLASLTYVLETGNLALEGPAQELHDNEHVRAAYLGIDRSDTEWLQAKASGWQRADLRWERLSEAALTAWSTRWRFRAICLIRLAYWQTRQVFDPSDRRIATSLINLGVAAGPGTGMAQRYLAKARHQWQASQGDVDDMVVRPRSRSSLFHLRMEARHCETYLANTRLRIGKIIIETSETPDALERGDRTLPHQHFSRWRGERLVVLDDMRKMLGASLLIADPV